MKLSPKQLETHEGSISGNSPGSKAFESSKALLEHHDSESLYIEIKALNEVIKESSDNSNKLGNKVFWLNIVIAVATVVAAISTAINVYLTFFKNVT